jgi:ferrous iron transport protein B
MILALVGNPNSGKTTLFNALTGLRQKVGNYPGVTVERKEGTLGGDTLIDLPGLYSLTPHSPDERIARDVLLGYRTDTPRPDVVLNIVDASNIERNLYLTCQLLELGLPLVIVLTMNDTAARRGRRIDVLVLSKELGVAVFPVDVARREGITSLVEALTHLPVSGVSRRLPLPPSLTHEAGVLAALLQDRHDLREPAATVEAVGLLGMPDGEQVTRWSSEVQEQLSASRSTLATLGIDPATAVAEARYAEIGRIVARTVHEAAIQPESVTEKLDRIFLHRVWGYVIFLALMLILFQAMFSWAEVPKGWIEVGVGWLSERLHAVLGPGDLRELLDAALLGGVGTTLTFLPQILLMFLFIGLLEDTGYLARAAFLMDRLMSRVGLHGKSFIPLLSSYACAIPGIMATRTIESSKARLITILVAPLMSCSARIPVYTLLIGAFIPGTLALGVQVGGVPIGIGLPALTLFCMYALGTAAAFCMAWLFTRTISGSEPPTFLLEMPPYRRPDWRMVLLRMGEQATQFVTRAGTVILALSVVMWFLAAYPRTSKDPARQLAQSYAGRLGKAIEPTIAPLGFDWKMGVGLISSFAAREVFVSTMATIYSVGDPDDTKTLTERLKSERRTDGTPAYTPLVAVCLMVFYVLAMQCLSTVAVVKRETGGWRWPLFQVAYMTALAWGVTFLVRVVGGLWLSR